MYGRDLLSISELGPDELDMLLQTAMSMKRDGSRPVLAHCASGNRVGGLYYAYLMAKRGLPREDALEQARASGLRSDALVTAVDQWLARRPAP